MSFFKFKSLVLFIKIVTKLLLLRPSLYLCLHYLNTGARIKIVVVVVVVKNIYIFNN